MVVGLGGEPATGKSLLARALLDRLGPGRAFRVGTVRGTVHRGGVLVLGRYDVPGTYPGTDRLSMAVQPEASRLIASPPPWARAAFFEGDRLFNAPFLRGCLDADPGSRFFLLEAAPATRAARRAARSDTKSVAFLRGRATKLARIRARFPAPILESLPGETPADLERNLDRIAAVLRIDPGLSI